MKNLWDKQPQETDKSFNRFRLYRDMGSGRSLRKVAQSFGLDPSSIAEMAKRYSWQKRANEFDAYLDQATQHNQKVYIKEMKERQIDMALEGQKVVLHALKEMLQKLKTGQLNLMRPLELAKLMDICCRLERLNRDEPEQSVEVTQKENYDLLTLEELETLRSLHLKAQGGE